MTLTIELRIAPHSTNKSALCRVMSHKKGGVLFSKVSTNKDGASSDSDDQYNVVEPPSMISVRSGMMSMATHNEYSDLEDNDSDEDSKSDGNAYYSNNDFLSFTGRPFLPKTMENTLLHSQKHAPKNAHHAPLDNTPNTMVSQYGIGAKLMMKMGYKQGKGLGAKQDGIAVPIETKLRPQGLGIGGINEGLIPKEDLLSSDEIDTKDCGRKRKETVAFSRPTYELFPVIDALEKAGVKVPVYYKELSDNPGSNTDLAKLEQAHARLSGVSTSVASIDAKTAGIELEIEHIGRSLDAETAERCAVALLVEKVAAFGLEKTPEETLVFLEELSQEQFAKVPGIERVFAGFAKGHVTRCFEANITNPELLLRLAVAYRALESDYSPSSLNLWDSLMLHNLKNHQNDASLDLRLWLDSPAIINTPLMEEICMRDMVLPALQRRIDNWDLFKGFDSAIIETLADFQWDDSMARQVVAEVAQKYRDFFDSCWKKMLGAPEGVLVCFEMQMEPVLAHYSLTGSVLIAQYHEHKANELHGHFVSGLTRFCLVLASKENNERPALFLLCRIHYSLRLVSEIQLEMLLLFTVLNPAVHRVTLMLQSRQNRQNRQNLQNPIPWFYVIQNTFLAVSSEFPAAENIFLWYTNAIIERIRGFRGFRGFQSEAKKNKTTPLPCYNQKELVGENPDQLVLLVLKQGKSPNTSVYGVASQDLLVTFKDVVQDACSRYNVLFRATGRRHGTRMHEIYEMKMPNGELFECFLAQDVVYVRSRADFAPTDIEEFLARHAN